MSTASPDHGFYVDLQKTDDGNLRIALTESGWENFADIEEEQLAHGTLAALYALLEDHLCDGWEMVPPEDLGALTAAPILSDDIVRDDRGQIVAAAHNRRILDADPTAHAEMLAIRAAAKALGDWRLEGCTLAVTLEPCCMCAGAIVLARIERLVYGAADPKAGAVDTLYRLCSDERLNHRVQVVSGIGAGECGSILTRFFQAQRALGKK